MKNKILVVDDEPVHLKMLETVLRDQGYSVALAGSGDAAIRATETQFYDLILLDMRMPGMDGLETLNSIKAVNPGVPIIIMTAFASVKTAVKAMKTGAYDYITKPIDIDMLSIQIRTALEHHGLEQENRLLRERLGAFDFAGMIGGSAKMKKLFETVAMAAPSDAAILISGESGTGKELVANAIHNNSLRKDRPFVKINCAALPETLLESELFGHEKGAFTGALHRKKGRFELAHTGSVFLDEVAEMTPATQAKLLRFLQEQEFELVGGSRTVKVDVRIIAATNQVLEDRILSRRFREDLFYRLNVLNIKVPPLRERKDDILELANFFLKKYGEKNRRLIKGFDPAAVDILTCHKWPGNVRELEHVVERAVILSRGEMISVGEFPGPLRDLAGENRIDDGLVNPQGTIKEMEKAMIIKTLADLGGNRTRAAQVLGISRRTLQLKLKAYGGD
jgi:two-component system response regulator HydG